MKQASRRGTSRERPVPHAFPSDVTHGTGDIAALALAAFAADELDEHELARCLGAFVGARAWRVVHRLEDGALALTPGQSWLVFKFPEQDAPERHAPILSVLALQIERAARRRASLEAERDEAEALRAAIDLFAPAVLILDRTLAVVFASAALREQFGDGSSLRQVLNDGAACAALAPRILAACGGEAGADLLLLRVGEREIGALVVPTTAGLAVVVLADARQPRLPDHDSLRILLRLSRAEAEILGAMSAGATLAAIASNRRASRETVRSQVKSTLAKLGLKTQGQAIGHACASLASLRLPALRSPGVPPS